MRLGAAALAARAAPGTGAAIVTLGDKGALLAHQGSVGGLPAPKVEVVDTAGAGDVMVGTLAGVMAAGLLVGDGLRLALAAASLSVTRRGTTPSFPSRAEIDALRNQA
jgi:ribokinase